MLRHHTRATIVRHAANGGAARHVAGGREPVHPGNDPSVQTVTAAPYTDTQHAQAARARCAQPRRLRRAPAKMILAKYAKESTRAARAKTAQRFARRRVARENERPAAKKSTPRLAPAGARCLRRQDAAACRRPRRQTSPRSRAYTRKDEVCRARTDAHSILYDAAAETMLVAHSICAPLASMPRCDSMVTGASRRSMVIRAYTKVRRGAAGRRYSCRYVTICADVIIIDVDVRHGYGGHDSASSSLPSASTRTAAHIAARI